MTDLAVGLLDVVPWTHGYAHSWAMRWLLEKHQGARDAVMQLFVPDHDRPWEVCDVRLEQKVGRHRADLHFVAVGADREPRTVILETKVNDDLKEGQLEAYCRASEHVVLYVPGLTGLLLSENPRRQPVQWVSGRQVVDALASIELPPLLNSYIDEVEGHARDMEFARQAARGERDELPAQRPKSGTRSEDLEAVAWVVETARFMREGGASPWTRNTRHDYGVYWPVPYDSDLFEANAYVDVIAGHGGHEYAICIKAGDGDVEDRRELFDAADKPPGPRWRRNRRSRAANYRLWTLDASDMTAQETAKAALAAGSYVQRLVSP